MGWRGGDAWSGGVVEWWMRPQKMGVCGGAKMKIVRERERGKRW